MSLNQREEYAKCVQWNGHNKASWEASFLTYASDKPKCWLEFLINPRRKTAHAQDENVSDAMLNQQTSSSSNGHGKTTRWEMPPLENENGVKTEEENKKELHDTTVNIEVVKKLSIVDNRQMIIDRFKKDHFGKEGGEFYVDGTKEDAAVVKERGRAWRYFVWSFPPPFDDIPLSVPRLDIYELYMYVQENYGKYDKHSKRDLVSEFYNMHITPGQTFIAFYRKMQISAKAVIDSGHLLSTSDIKDAVLSGAENYVTFNNDGTFSKRPTKYSKAIEMVDEHESLTQCAMPLHVLVSRLTAIDVKARTIGDSKQNKLDFAMVTGAPVLGNNFSTNSHRYPNTNARRNNQAHAGRGNASKGPERPCKFFLKGNCLKGDKCNHPHPVSKGTNYNSQRSVGSKPTHPRAPRTSNPVPRSAGKSFPPADKTSRKCWDCGSPNHVRPCPNKAKETWSLHLGRCQGRFRVLLLHQGGRQGRRAT